MDSDAIARKVQEEHERLRVITSELRKAIDQPCASAPEPWLAEVRKRFEHFRAHMYHRLALEEQGGFLEEALAVRPTVAPEVEHCRAEHREIIQMIDRVYTQLGAASPREIDGLEDLVLRIRHLLSEVDHHEAHENMLVLHVFHTDIGGHG